jgi:hypothetical protein
MDSLHCSFVNVAHVEPVSFRWSGEGIRMTENHGVLELSSPGNRAVMVTPQAPITGGDGDTMIKTIERAREAVLSLGDLPAQLSELESMTSAQLAAKWRAGYGEPTRSRNKDYLRKRLAWRIQELAEGGLPDRTLTQIVALGDQLPERWRMRQATPVATLPAAPPLVERDPRLPPVGTVLTRVYEGASHSITLRDDGFEYAGEVFRTLSAVARKITGTPWNGFVFFGLKNTGAIKEQS